LNILNILICLLIILLRSGWFTLLERKILSYSQTRVGPNKVSHIGVCIPIVDFIKLSMKNSLINTNNILIYSICIKILIRLILLRFCKHFSFISNILIIFYIILISRLIGYAILLPSLTTKRLYRVLGIIRIFRIILRFEIRLFLLIIIIYLISLSNNIEISILILPIIRLFCIIIFIIEINRHPFEVIEGESELVSGFNVELRSLVFMVFFLREIINITVITIIMCLIYKLLSIYCALIAIVLLARSSFPRIRYDYIIIFQWTSVYLVIISLTYMC